MLEPERPSQDLQATPPQAAPLLPYRCGREDLPQTRKAIGEAIGGALLSIIAVCGVVASWMLANLDLNPPPHSHPPFNWKDPAVITVIVASLLTFVTLFARYRRGKRAFALGVLIGIGLAALIEGICFSSVLR